MDKALVGVVWALALVYSLLTQQILSKEVDIPCSVRWESLTKYDLIIDCFSDSLESGFGLVSVIVSLLLPAVVGPLLSLIVLLLTSCIFLWTRVKYSEVNNQ